MHISIAGIVRRNEMLVIQAEVSSGQFCIVAKQADVKK